MMNKKSALDLQYLRTMTSNDEETMKTLMETLLKELDRDYRKARNLYQERRWSELERFCHYFKSTLSFSGNSSLINANLQLWELAKNNGGSTQIANKVLSELERQCQSTARELRSALKTI